MFSRTIDEKITLRLLKEQHAKEVFSLEGILRQSWWSKERFADLVVYGLLSSEWQVRKS